MKPLRALIGLLFCINLPLAWLVLSPDRYAETARSTAAGMIYRKGETRLNLHDRPLSDRLAETGFKIGQPVVLRLFKSESRLEVWMKRAADFELAMTLPICRWSGALGPKLKEGDGQSPEGFYQVNAKHLKPDSNYYRAINIGFPNVFDRSLGRTGSFLMIHGNCVSIGCYAMTDAGIDDIYKLVEAALNAGQKDIQVQIYPFEMTPENLAQNKDAPWADFWNNLAEGDALFQKSKKPLKVRACAGRYVFGNADQAGCESVEAW